MKAFSLFIDKKQQFFLENQITKKQKTKQNKIINIFFQKYHGLVFGLVGLNHYVNFLGCLGKVRIFWEGHKIWKNLPLKIWHYWMAANYSFEVKNIEI